MIEQYNWKKKLSALLVLISVLLTGCGGEEEKLNSYSLEEIRGNQVVFARTYANWNGMPTRLIWIYNKYGQCKRIDLIKSPKVEHDDEKQYLANLDECMVDDKVPFLKSKLGLPDEKISYCINLQEIELSKVFEDNGCDGNGETYYVVLGVKEKRRLIKMRKTGLDGLYASDNETLEEICQILHNASEFPE